MNKLLIGLLAAVIALPAWADGYRGGYHGGYHNHGGHSHGGDWIAPLIIGGTVGYILSQPRTVYVQPQPQIIYQNSNAPLGYHWEALLDGQCNCYRTVLVPN